MAGQHLFDTFEKGVLAGRILEDRIVHEGSGFRLGAETGQCAKSLYLRGEGQSLAVICVIERLDAETVAGQHEPHEGCSSSGSSLT